jgi:hypothetical protein
VAVRVAPVVALSVGNILIFWKHYFRGYGFPWDFLGSYYSMVAYWTSAVRHGVFPQWVPFQSMGYPLPVNLQSGLFYPVFWIFPALRLPYSIHRAVVLQCLYLLLGALGAYAFLRRAGRCRRDALLGAFAFQLFGGFYSNAEHADIVRGDALVPWLLWTLTLPPARSRGSLGPLLFLPLVIYFMATGGYAGIFLAGLFLGTLWVALQAISRRKTAGASDPLRFAAAAAALAVLGLAMAAVGLGPAWLHRSELARYQEYSGFEAVGLDLRHLPGLFLPNRWLAGNVSMTSTYLPLPLLLAALWAPARRRDVRAVLGLLAASLLMVPGPASPVYRAACALAPPLGYSRLPAADYRVFVALALVLLAASGFSRLRRQRAIWRSWRLPTAAALLAGGVAAIVPVRSERPVVALLALSFVASALLLPVRPRRAAAAAAIAGCVAVLMLADAGRVLLRMQHWNADLWRLPDVEEFCRRTWTDVPAERFEGVLPASLFRRRPGPRPARRPAPPGYRAAGYLKGDLLMSDYGSGSVLAARRLIEADRDSVEFMRRPWTGALIFDGKISDPGNEASVPASLLATAAPTDRARQTSWGNERNEYEIRLAQPALLVENEVYFSGWTGTASAGGERMAAVRVNGRFRGWRLAPGHYQLSTRFSMPRLPLLIALSATGAIAYAGVVVWRGRRRREEELIAAAESESESGSAPGRRSPRSPRPTRAFRSARRASARPRR